MEQKSVITKVCKMVPARILAVTVSCLLSASTFAEGDWQVQPSLNVSSTYSDNIDLEPNGESDLVTDVSTGIGVSREGRRLKVELDYNLQNLVYQDDSSRNTSNHQLSSTVNSEILADTLFVDFNSSISQQLINRRASGSSDGISGSDNLSNVFSYSVSPYWQQHLGNIADFELRYTHDRVKSNGSAGGSGDSDGNAVSFDIANGSATGRINWNIGYDVQQTRHDDGAKNDTESANARVGYQLTDRLNTFVSGTYENNEFSGSRGSSEPDDSTVGAGFTWQPSPDFTLTALYNERLDPRPDEDGAFVSGDVFWAPTARTDINIGLDNSFFGETYSANVNHRARWTRWGFSYDEGTSDFRSLALQQNFIACPAGATTIAQCRTLVPGEVLLPGELLLGTNQGLLTTINTNITNDTFINKTGRVSVSIVGARNTVTLAITDTERKFVADNNTEKDSAVDISWLYKFSPRTDSSVTVGQTQQQFDDGQEDEFMRYAWRVSTKLGGSSALYVEAQVNERDSVIATRRYEENRLTVGFEKFF